MRKLRSRLALFLTGLVLVTSAVTLFLTYYFMVQSSFAEEEEMVRWFFYGSAIKDVLLLLVAMAVIIITMFFITRGTTSPIRTLSNAAKQIAQGNYDVQVQIRQDRVAEFGDLQNNFNAMAQELKNNDYLRKDFISGVSHELKTPLAIIEGYADLLQEEDLSDAERKEYAAAIAEESARLSHMTENMLRLSRIDLGRQKPDLRSYMLDEQIRQSVILLEPQWSAKNIDMQVDLQAISLFADEELMAQVWLNLIDNAIKFSQDNSIVIVRAQVHGDRVHVMVRDYGIGMDDVTKSRIFERFYQGDTSRKQSGSGLGLSLVHRIVQLHKGTVRAETNLGRGTAMIVELPKGQSIDLSIE